MSFDIQTTLNAVASKMQASGYFQNAIVQIGEPKSPPTGQGISAAIWMNRVGVVGTTLTKTIESHVISVRLYTDMLAEPQEDIEMNLAAVTSDFMGDLCGEYDLGGTIRNVDFAGEYGTGLSAEWGHVDVSGKMCRVVDITIPLTVDDSGTFVA